jgi:hypothetical protein
MKILLVVAIVLFAPVIFCSENQKDKHDKIIIRTIEDLNKIPPMKKEIAIRSKLLSAEDSKPREDNKK